MHHPGIVFDEKIAGMKWRSKGTLLYARRPWHACVSESIGLAV
jgi:hypothetical protein